MVNLVATIKFDPLRKIVVEFQKDLIIDVFIEQLRGMYILEVMFF